MRVGVAEFEDHLVFVDTLCRILKCGKIETHLFTTEKIFARLRPLMGSLLDEIKVITKNNDESWKSFVDRLNVYCSAHTDFVFVQTMQEDWRRLPAYARFRPRCPTALITARYTDWFGTKFGITSSRPKLVFGHNFTVFWKRKIKKNFSSYVFHSPETVPFIKEKFKEEKPLFSIPFALNKSSSTRLTETFTPRGPLRVAITGGISWLY
jgi:hypothetical protein